MWIEKSMFEIGNQEKHHVKIEKIRKLLLAGFRKTKLIACKEI